MYDEAARSDDTDWRQILGPYELRHSIASGPMITLNRRIVTVAMVQGPQASLSNLPRRRPKPRSPDTTESTPSAHACSTWPVIGRRHGVGLRRVVPAQSMAKSRRAWSATRSTSSTAGS